jgi:transposase-like protein
VLGPTPHHLSEFKRGAVDLYRSSGTSVPKVTEELGIFRRWIRQHEVDTSTTISTSMVQGMSALVASSAIATSAAVPVDLLED